MKKALILLTALLGLVVGAVPATAASGKPGVIFEATFSGVCSFDVYVILEGKSKDIVFDDRAIFVAPDQKVTLSANGKTLEYVITGVRQEVKLADGTYLSTVTGRNVLVNSIGASERPGFWLVVGTFHYILTAPNGDEVEPFNLDGPGQVTDVCALLA
jgi:hypothetical protein